MGRASLYASSACELMMIIAMALGQNPATLQRERETAGGRDRAKAGQLDEKTTGAMIRVSQLIGMNIQNSQDEGVGEVNDVVVDAASGRVRYLAVTYGGFLGVGDKLFAVPFEAFKVRQDPGDADSYVLMLDVTQKHLEGAQGFDEEHWPDFADSAFTAELDKRYGIDRKKMRRGADVEIDVNRDGFGVDIKTDDETDSK